MYVRQSRASRSRCSIPGAWYTIHASTKQTTDSEVRRSVSRVKTPCEQGLPHYTCYKHSNAFLLRRRRRSAVYPWNVDPLRSTTLRGIRSARRSRGKSSALNRKSCHALVPVTLEKLNGCGRTDKTGTSPILPDGAHDSRNDSRVVSLSALSPLSACVRLRQLREVHHKLQQALSP